MDIFNIISGICSIVGLGVSLFVASKVSKITNSNNDNKGEILAGEGKQMIAKGHSAVADNHSIIHYTDNRDAVIFGEVDEFPILTEEKYFISAKNNDRYRQGICKDACELMPLGNLGSFCFSLNFLDIVSKPEDARWIGYSIKSLPMNDWRSFVEESYKLCFQYESTGSINEFWIEITNFQLGKKVYKEKIELSKKSGKRVIEFGQFKNTIGDWKSIDEICFVFFPENCIGTFGVLYISELEICK